MKNNKSYNLQHRNKLTATKEHKTLCHVKIDPYSAFLFGSSILPMKLISKGNKN